MGCCSVTRSAKVTVSVPIHESPKAKLLSVEETKENRRAESPMPVPSRNPTEAVTLQPGTLTTGRLDEPHADVVKSDSAAKTLEPLTAPPPAPAPSEKTTSANLSTRPADAAVQPTAPVSSSTELKKPDTGAVLEAAKVVDMLSLVNKEKVEAVLKSAPERSKSNLLNLCRHLKANQESLSLLEKAWLAYRWMCLNMEHVHHEAEKHTKKRKSTKLLESTTPEGLFRAGKASAAGFTALFKQIAGEMGVVSVCVQGILRGDDDPEKCMEAKSNHEWNAISIEGKWYLVDTMCGAGKVVEDKFAQQFDDYYFCTSPQRFIRTHYPEEDKWQLMDPPVSLDTARQLLGLGGQFFSAGFLSVEPDQAILKVAGRTQIHISYGAKLAPDAMVTLRSLDTGSEIKGATFVQRVKGRFEIDLAVSQVGKFDLVVTAARDQNAELGEAFRYRVLSEASATKLVKFPEQYRAYNQLNALIHAPKEGLLDQDVSYRFRLEAPKAEKTAVVVGQDWIFLSWDSKIASFAGKADIQAADVSVYAKLPGDENYICLLTYQVNTFGKALEHVAAKKDEDVLKKNAITGYPAEGLLHADDKGLVQVRLRFSDAQDTRFMAKLIGSQGTTLEGYALVQHEKGRVQIDASLPESGDYNLQIFAHNKKDEDKSYSFALGYFVRGKAEVVGRPFVMQYPIFVEATGYVYEPIEATLKGRDKIKFRIRAKGFITLELESKRGKKIILSSEGGDIFSTSGLVEVPSDKGEMILYGTQKGSSSLKALLKYEVV